MRVRINRVLDPSYRRWRVDYDEGEASWSGYYKTRLGVGLATWWFVILPSKGGRLHLLDQHDSAWFFDIFDSQR